MFEAFSSLSVVNAEPSSNETLKYRDFAIVKFEAHLEKRVSFYLQFEIPQFPNLSWPLEAIKILFAYFNHLIEAKSSLDSNMRIIQNFVSWG